MLCDPPDICATRFFDREDPDKKFMMEQIRRCLDAGACAVTLSDAKLAGEYLALQGHVKI